MLAGFKLRPFIVEPFHPITENALSLMSIIKSREINRERAIAFFQTNDFSNRDIFVKVVTSCQYILIIHHQMGEDKLAIRF